MPEDVAGAPFMAVGSSAPEFFTVIRPARDRVGRRRRRHRRRAAVFNSMTIVGLTGIFAPGHRRSPFNPPSIPHPAPARSRFSSLKCACSRGCSLIQRLAHTRAPTHTPQRSTTTEALCSGPPAAPPSPQPPPTNTPLPTLRCASRMGRASRLRPPNRALSATCSLLYTSESLRDARAT